MEFYLVRFKNQEKALFRAVNNIAGNEYAEYRAQLKGSEVEDVLVISEKQAKKIGLKNINNVFLMDKNDDPYEWISLQ